MHGSSPLSIAIRSGASRLVALASLALVVLLARPARADTDTAHSVSVVVLGLDSDDAEDQADALTGALRSRIRASEGWSLVDSSQSLGMLVAALRCNKPIDAECEQKMAEQLKADRFVFGWVKRGPQRGEVTAEVHLYQRGRPDTVVRESYAENLKEQNDDTLRAVAQRVVDRFGATAVGTIVVRVGAGGGEVVVDGAKRVPLSGGLARIEASPGGHSVEVVVEGQPPRKRNVLVAAGKESVVDLSPAASADDGPAAAGSSFPLQKVLGGTLAVGGIAAGIVSVVNLLAYSDDQDRARANEADPNPAILKLPEGKRAEDVCNDDLYRMSEICAIEASSRRHSTIAIATGAGGAALLIGGAVLFLTGGGGDHDATTGAAPKPKAGLAPSFGRGSGSVVLSGTF